MDFNWDENKNQQNITKHGIDFIDVQKVFDNPILFKEDKRKDYSEKRFIGIGEMLSIIIVVIWTFRKNTIRIISARLANKKEREIYHERIDKN
ncbi:BrnT family toxin [Bacteroidota bacterium]